MKEMTFETVGQLPVAAGQWHIRLGGGHVWFVNEDRTAGVFALVDNVLVPVVDTTEQPDAPLIMPKVFA